MAYFLGIDVGTSSVKAVLVDERQALAAESAQPLAVSRPHPGWSEQDPEDWWTATLAAVAAIREQAPTAFAAVEAIGLSGQQHSATLIDGGGRFLRPAILWNDGRSGAECEELLKALPDYPRRAFNVPMPGFTAPKLLWVARHEPDIFAAVARVLLPKDVVRWKLSGAFVSDMSDSAGTLWLDIAGRRWDDDLLAAGRMRRDQMPDLVEGSAASAFLHPDIAAAWGLAGRRIPIAGGGGDNASSAVGIGAVADGAGFLSLGTSGVLFVTTDRPVMLPERTLHGFCHALPGRWHGMTVVLSAAFCVEWAATLLGRGNDIAGFIAGAEAYVQDTERRASAPLFLPYLTGERTPWNDPDATGTFAGLRAGHDAGALAHAVLEGVAFALADGLEVLTEAGAAPRSCMLVGGGARSPYWCQLIADVLGIALDLPEGADRGAAFGAARLGMLAAGAGTVEVVCTAPAIRRRFVPERHADAVTARRRQAWRELYRDQVRARAAG